MRLVIKLGSSTLSLGKEKLHKPQMVEITRQMAALHAQKHEVAIISSGAILAGKSILKAEKRKDIPYKQMLAAVGQNQLMSLYTQFFGIYGVAVAQALLTRVDFSHRLHYLNARNTILSLLERRIIPIINENDVVSVEEIKIGDNDNLSALVANLIDADRLIILTDCQGLYTADPAKNPEAQLIKEVRVIDDALRALAGPPNGGQGTGGMATKIQAAELAMRSGVETIIADGVMPDVLIRLAQGEAIGTRFFPSINHLESRKRWILAEKASGSLAVDDGAARALMHAGKSLLAAGILSVSGDFSRGEVVTVTDSGGQALARGVSNYGSASLGQIKGLRSDQIEGVLGYQYGEEVIHRDNMALLS
jgi:glutamate 5-kinase